jgi:hypothetical protein
MSRLPIRRASTRSSPRTLRASPGPYGREPLYGDAAAHFATHETVHHSSKEYVRGDLHTNSAEGFFSIFKRGMRGIYQHCGEKYLHRYLAEYDFRYNSPRQTWLQRWRTCCACCEEVHWQASHVPSTSRSLITVPPRISGSAGPPTSAMATRQRAHSSTPIWAWPSWFPPSTPSR